jgi:hypothetical protein
MSRPVVASALNIRNFDGELGISPYDLLNLLVCTSVSAVVVNPVKFQLGRMFSFIQSTLQSI